MPARFVLADVTVYDFEPERTDLAVLRFGVMFFADPARSFANPRKGLKLGGRSSSPAGATPREIHTLSCRSVERASAPPPPPETGAGPFALANDARVRRILGDAGYADIVLTPQDLEFDVAARRRLHTAVEGTLAIGSTTRMLEGQSEAVRAATTADIRSARAAHARGDSVPLGAWPSG